MDRNSSSTYSVLESEERARYVHTLQEKHGFSLGELLAWLAAYRSTAHWEVRPFSDITSAVQRTYSYGIFSGERNAKYDTEMLEMTSIAWNYQHCSNWILFQEERFYPVMDVLLLLIFEFMERYSPSFAEISGEGNAKIFAMNWITFQLRFYFSQISEKQCEPYS